MESHWLFFSVHAGCGERQTTEKGKSTAMVRFHYYNIVSLSVPTQCLSSGSSLCQCSGEISVWVCSSCNSVRESIVDSCYHGCQSVPPALSCTVLLEYYTSPYVLFHTADGGCVWAKVLEVVLFNCFCLTYFSKLYLATVQYYLAISSDWVLTADSAGTRPIMKQTQLPRSQEQTDVTRGAGGKFSGIFGRMFLCSIHSFARLKHLFSHLAQIICHPNQGC